MSHDDWKSKVIEELNYCSGDFHVNPPDKIVRRGEYDYRFFRDAAKTVFSVRITHMPTGETVTGVTHNHDDLWTMVENLESELNGKISQILTRLGIVGADAAAVKWIGNKPKL